MISLWFNNKQAKFTNPTGKAIRNDSFGLGHFAAPRSSKVSKRKNHEGVDYEAVAGQKVVAVMGGTISKIGYPYASDLNFRYVEISSKNGYRVRQFYVAPYASIKKGMLIKKGENIGSCQNLAIKYRGMKNHIHVEIKKNGALVNPEGLIKISI